VAAAVVTAASKAESTLLFQDGSKGQLLASEFTWSGQRLRTGDIVYAEAAKTQTLANGKTEPAPAGSYVLRQIPAANGAIVAIDPFTGHVRALSGGFSYGSSQFNRATQAMRQPGSTFKPSSTQPRSITDTRR